MVLGIIALVIALAALALGIFTAIRVFSLEKEAERVNWTVKGIEATVKSLKDKQEMPIHFDDAWCYDPETTTHTLSGNLRVTGWVSAGDTKE